MGSEGTSVRLAAPEPAALLADELVFSSTYHKLLETKTRLLRSLYDLIFPSHLPTIRSFAETPTVTAEHFKLLLVEDAIGR